MKVSPINHSFLNIHKRMPKKNIYFGSTLQNDCFSRNAISPRAKVFIDAGLKIPFNMYRMESMSEADFQKILEFYLMGVNEFDLIYFLEELDKKLYPEAVEYFKIGITGADLIGILKKLSQEEKKNAFTFAQTGCFNAFELRIIFEQNLNPRQIDEIYQLASYGCFKGCQILRYLQENRIQSILDNNTFQKNATLIKKINAIESQITIVMQYLINKLIDEEYSLTSEEGYLELISQLECLLTNQEFQSSLTEEEKEVLAIEDEIIKLKKEYSKKISIMPVQKEKIKNFATNFLSNKPDSEEVLKNFDFQKYGKNGLPLKFKRKDFAHELFTIINEMDKKQQKEILKKLEITPNATNYDGIINFKNLDQNDIFEKEIYDLCINFFLKNKITTNDEKVNKALNSLIEAYPEFLNIIGKKQHGTHNLSLDIHILSVLKESLNNPEYQNLSNESKTLLKLSCLFHDISKKENIIDEKHPDNSASWANALLEKLNFNQDFNKRILNIISKHHWLKTYNWNHCFDDIATRFSNKEDFKIAKIIAESDLKSIQGFWESYGKVLEKSNMKPIEETINDINESGAFILPTQIARKDLIPKVFHNGSEYRVINFNDYSDTDDLEKIGFHSKTTKKDISFLIHATQNAKDLEKLIYLLEQSTPIILSTSLLTLQHKGTYMNRKFMFNLESPQHNILTVSAGNMSSGTRKGAEKINSYKRSTVRYVNGFRIAESLNLSREEYGKLFKLFSHIKSITQIQDEKIYEIGEKKLSGKEIKEAVLKVQRLYTSEFDPTHNEIIIQNPNIKSLIAKVDDISEIPDEYLNLCKKHNLPILIIGK